MTYQQFYKLSYSCYYIPYFILNLVNHSIDSFSYCQDPVKKYANIQTQWSNNDKMGAETKKDLMGFDDFNENQCKCK